ncbi:MAG: hypothetical protein R6X35_14890 [Candidatus Krumholzibacteriia bacterium]
MIRPLRAFLLLLSALPFVLLLLHGCGSDSAAPDQTGGTVRDATLAVGSSVSFGRVGVAGLPAPQEEAKAQDFRVIIETAGAETFSFPLDHDAEGWFFPAPLHPVTPNDGGALLVRIGDGTDESAPQDLTVGALPPAPGAFASLVATMREHLEQRAVWAGTSIAELQATPAGELAPLLLPLKVAQAYLDDPGDPRDLTDLAGGADGFLDDQDAELLDRVFGYFALESLLRLEIDGFAAVDTTEDEGAGPTLLGAGPAEAAGATAGKACISARWEISTAYQLSKAMIRSAVAQFGADPASDAGQILSKGGLAMATLGVAPGLGVPAGVAGAVLASVQGSVGAVAGLLPSYFVLLECEVDKQEFNEDSREVATYSNVWVRAASTGWSADQAVSGVVTSLLGSYLSSTDKLKIMDSEVLRDIGAAGVGLGAAEVFEDTGLIEFCSEDWDIDISSPVYSTAAAIARRFDVDIEAQTATPREAGQDQLQVAAQSAKFGGRQIHQDVPMEVLRIQVDVTPPDIYVMDPGSDVDITTAIRHADLTTLRWTTAHGTWQDGLGSDTNDGGTRPLRTPEAASAYPFLVSVESLTRYGARASGLPPRVGSATIRLGQPTVRVEPEYACIQPGETQQFTAKVTGVQDSTVVWDVIEGYGTIDQNGLYTSFNEGTSNAVIEARLAAIDTVAGQAELDAAACNCAVTIAITGDAVWNSSGSQAAYTVSYFDDYFYQFWFDIGSDDFPGITANLGFHDDKPSPVPGDTGQWKVSFGFVTANESWASVWDEENVPLPGVTLTITELTETTMIGRFTGNAFQLDVDGTPTSIIGVDVDIRAAYWDGGGWPCE